MLVFAVFFETCPLSQKSGVILAPTLVLTHAVYVCILTVMQVSK